MVLKSPTFIGVSKTGVKFASGNSQKACDLTESWRKRKREHSKTKDLLFHVKIRNILTCLLLVALLVALLQVSPVSVMALRVFVADKRLRWTS